MTEDENLTKKIKEIALEYGADKVGIADAELAEDPPHGHGEPLKILPNAKSIISIVVAYPDGVFEKTLLERAISIDAWGKSDSLRHVSGFFIERLRSRM